MVPPAVRDVAGSVAAARPHLRRIEVTFAVVALLVGATAVFGEHLVEAGPFPSSNGIAVGLLTGAAALGIVAFVGAAIDAGRAVFGERSGPSAWRAGTVAISLLVGGLAGATTGFALLSLATIAARAGGVLLAAAFGWMAALALAVALLAREAVISGYRRR